MKVNFTNLFKTNLYKNQGFEKKIIQGIHSLIKRNCFVGGDFVIKFEKSFSKFSNTSYCISVANGTDALEIAIEALNLPKNSEIIVPVNTWISTAEAVTRNGMKLVFSDISLDDYSIDVTDLKKKINKNTKAIIVVHLYGYPSKLTDILKIAKKNNIKIIEDCAQAHGTKYFNKQVGCFGDIATFSFFPGKNLGAFGDGGAIVTNNNKLNIFCKRLRNHGALQKYDHLFPGRNSRLDTLQSFVLCEKLKFYQDKIIKRNLLAKIYYRELSNIKSLFLPKLDFVKNYNSFHQFVIRLKKRDELANFLKKHKIETMVHYPYMLNELPFYKKQTSPKTLKNSYKLGKKILSLPISEEHSEKEIAYVCNTIRKFFNLLPSKH